MIKPNICRRGPTGLGAGYAPVFFFFLHYTLVLYINSYYFDHFEGLLRNSRLNTNILLIAGCIIRNAFFLPCMVQWTCVLSYFFLYIAQASLGWVSRELIDDISLSSL